MKEKLIKLIDVKSIITFVITGIFSYLAIKGEIESDVVMSIVTMVMAFYFGTQYQKTNINETGTNVSENDIEKGDE